MALKKCGRISALGLTFAPASMRERALSRFLLVKARNGRGSLIGFHVDVGIIMEESVGELDVGYYGCSVEREGQLWLLDGRVSWAAQNTTQTIPLGSMVAHLLQQSHLLPQALQVVHIDQQHLPCLCQGSSQYMAQRLIKVRIR